MKLSRQKRDATGLPNQHNIRIYMYSPNMHRSLVSLGELYPTAPNLP